MVRLKEVPKIFLQGTGGISIPYGAIKSHQCRCGSHSLFDISIPYGAIKRLRLTTIQCQSTIISIPYGAIKSV